ncbi:MAG: class I SAM-dependent methyltransferase [Ignavibacteriae bacterium]|nr:class I SAM-dependent methyltransferase [Ignavibacteriota bacterium]
MNCRLCGSNTRELFSAKILKKFDIHYFQCNNCNLLQTENPYWLDEAYNNPINLTDTGLLKRNIYFLEKTKTILFFYFNKEAKFLDYAGGYGVFTRLMRDNGFDFYWHDPYTQNIFSKGFELNESTNNFELVTAFECFEHFVNPLDEIKKITKFSRNILFSTNLLPNPIPKPEKWWYYGLEHGQHLSFYTKETLEYLAKVFELNLYSPGKILHLLTEKKTNKNIYKFVLNKSSNLSWYINKKQISKTFLDSQELKK